MDVLSLFDGISCGMVALNRANIKVDRYVAYEIDKYAISVSKNNFSNIEYMGNVVGADFKQYKGFDLVIGGSPCQDLSIANRLRKGLSGERSGLFFEFVRALDEVKPHYFLLENVASMSKENRDIISNYLGVEPIMINSALLSAQQRKRLYWTNIPNITQPEDKKIFLKDVLESGYPYQKKSYCYLRRQNTMVCESVPCALRTRKDNTGSYKRLEVKKDKKANAITSVQTDSMICTPLKIGEINGKKSQANRVYSVRGKSVTLSANGGGLGAKTGLYKIDLPDGDYYIRKLTPVECERLQTLPDNYTYGISNTQRYKCLGNAWTVNVIAHIFRNIPHDYF